MKVKVSIGYIDVLTSITSAASPEVTHCMASHIQLDGSLTELIGM